MASAATPPVAVELTRRAAGARPHRRRSASGHQSGRRRVGLVHPGERGAWRRPYPDLDPHSECAWSPMPRPVDLSPEPSPLLGLCTR